VENSALIAMFAKGLNCDEELAQDLVSNGFITFEEVAYVTTEEFEDTGLDVETIEALKENAREVLANPEALKQAEGIVFFVKAGFSQEEIEKFYAENIFDEHDFSELSVLDLQDILPEFDSVKAKDMIMRAREKETAHDN